MLVIEIDKMRYYFQVGSQILITHENDFYNYIETYTSDTDLIQGVKDMSG